MTRRKVLDACYTARSRADLQAAMEARSRYLIDHPRDDGILDMGEMLSKLQDALDILGVDEVEPAPLPMLPEREPASAA